MTHSVVPHVVPMPPCHWHGERLSTRGPPPSPSSIPCTRRAAEIILVLSCSRVAVASGVPKETLAPRERM